MQLFYSKGYIKVISSGRGSETRRTNESINQSTYLNLYKQFIFIKIKCEHYGKERRELRDWLILASKVNLAFIKYSCIHNQLLS